MYYIFNFVLAGCFYVATHKWNKKAYCLGILDKAVHLTLYSAQKRYRRDIVETGFSMRLYYRSAPVYHYQYKTVFDGTYRKIIVRFTNNAKIKIKIKEESALYKKLLNKSAF